MISLLKTIASSILFVSIILSCKISRTYKNDAFEGSCNIIWQASSDSQFLINKKWTEVSIEVIKHHNDSSDFDITDQFMKSDLDDLMIFKEDGTFVFDEGISKARRESNQIYSSGKWTLDQASSQLSLCMNGEMTIYEIITLKPELLILQLELKKPGKSYTYLLTYHPA